MTLITMTHTNNHKLIRSTVVQDREVEAVREAIERADVQGRWRVTYTPLLTAAGLVETVVTDRDDPWLR